MRFMALPILATVALATAGCVTSPVTKLDDQGDYVIAKHSVLGVSSQSALTDQATADADEFCATQGKVAHVKNAVTTGVPGLTSMGTNVVFDCVVPSAQR